MTHFNGWGKASNSFSIHNFMSPFPLSSQRNWLKNETCQINWTTCRNPLCMQRLQLVKLTEEWNDHKFDTYQSKFATFQNWVKEKANEKLDTSDKHGQYIPSMRHKHGEMGNRATPDLISSGVLDGQQLLMRMI